MGEGRVIPSGEPAGATCEGCEGSRTGSSMAKHKARALLAWELPHPAEKRALRLVFGVTVNNLKWFKPWKWHGRWSLRMLRHQRCRGIQRCRPDIGKSVYLISLCPFSPLPELNLWPRQHQKSWNRKIRAFIIRNSLFLLSRLGIFNWSNSAANTYLPRKTFSFKPSTYPNKERSWK